MFLALLSAFWAGGCSASRRSDAVGEFAGRSIACDEVRAFASEMAVRPAAIDAPELGHEQIFEELVVARMLEAEARRGRLDQTPAFRRRFRQVKQSLLHESIEEDVWADGSVVAGRQEAESGALPVAGVDDAERIEARMILRRVPADAAAARLRTAAAELRGVQARFLSGVPFAELAAETSEHESAAQGGALVGSAPGDLDPAVARVVARLEPGEISDVVRLPDGFALILRERAVAAGAASVPAPVSSVPKVVASLEARARSLAEQRARRREELLTEARGRFRVRFEAEALADTGPDFASIPVAYIDDEPYSLEDLDLRQRPPLLREAVSNAIDDELLARLAEAQAPPLLRAEIEAARRHLLAELAMEALLARRLLVESDAELRRRYDIEIGRFERGEQRVVEVVRVAAEAGNLNEALAAAEAIRRIWRPDGPLHQRTRAEVWGPLTSAELEAHTSVDLARAVFSLTSETVGPPILIPARTGGEPPIGYAVMRLHRVIPAGVVPFAEVREMLLAEAVRGASPSARAEIRARVLEQARAAVLPALFECGVRQPLPLEEAVRPSATAPESEAATRSIWSRPRALPR